MTDFHERNRGTEQATIIGNLQSISEQLADVEKARRKEEDNAGRLEQRIKSAELAHGQQLQQMSALQDAIERRRQQIRTDREAHQTCLSLQQQAHQRAEELRISIAVIATKLDEGSSHRGRDN